MFLAVTVEHFITSIDPGQPTYSSSLTRFYASTTGRLPYSLFVFVSNTLHWCAAFRMSIPLLSLAFNFVCMFFLQWEYVACIGAGN